MKPRIAFVRVYNGFQYKYELVALIKMGYNIFIHVKFKTIGKF